MQPGDILPLAFDKGLVILSFVISVLGAYVALLAASRIRDDGGKANMGYVAVAAIALGGVSIWGMHFIGVVAQVIPFGVSYDLPLTLLSFVVAVGFAGGALWYVGRTRFTFGRCALGGILAGLGVASMHYLGMGSMRMNAYFDWDALLVLVSIGIAMVAASVSLWLAFNLYREIQRIGAAVLMAVAVCGMHYTGVAAGTIICTTPREFGMLTLDGALLPYAVFLVSMVMLIVMWVELYRSSAEARQTTVRRMEKVLSGRGSVETD